MERIFKFGIPAVRFSLNKKLVRRLGIGFLGILILLGIWRACFFTEEPQKLPYYLIARNINWNDFDFTGKEHNVQAFIEELVQAASKESDLHVQLVLANPRNLLEDLRAKQYDAVFTFMVPNSLNQEIYHFSEPLYMLGSVLIVPEASDANHLEDMEGKAVGIKAGSSSIYEVKDYPSIIIMTYDNMNMALNDLENGRIDGVIMDNWNAQINTTGPYKGRLKVATPSFTPEGLRLATLANPEMKDFLESFNDGLERLQASGEYQKLIKRWDLY